jgi:predicted SnoaL-like aldol condensation-catalyzing enzyme
MDDSEPRIVKPSFGYDRSVPHKSQFQFRIVRAFEDEGLIFVHAAHAPVGEGSGWVTMSLMSSKPDCQVDVGHQVTMRVDVKVNPDKTMVAGTKQLGDLGATDRNKAHVKGLFDVVMTERRVDQIGRFMNWSDFRSHHPDLEPDTNDFHRYLERLLLCTRPLRVIAVHDIIGQGNFVAAFSTVEWRDCQYKVCDLFRMADGLIVEHWDVFEPVRARGMASNDTGLAGAGR